MLLSYENNGGGKVSLQTLLENAEVLELRHSFDIFGYTRLVRLFASAFLKAQQFHCEGTLNTQYRRKFEANDRKSLSFNYGVMSIQDVQSNQVQKPNFSNCFDKSTNVF